ncbi:hypothetical protein SLH49_02650 [Cognatiyoonia sp. IB215446]|uniref:DUF6931 family protein n=1 Tax=Cognatiyoonia sp. IB215446 TaxID=3097355 RepID=UPI002A1176C8|nr:hypothetical protein [Cognatiyoonia sp. IB215446]MDX8346876.1 hypothetical protein [Cognatiyoonia sp. IB215446]
MTSPRFDDLKKLPTHPAARIIAHNNIVLQTPVTAPASATVAQLLSELHEKGAVIDMMQLLAHALPPRETTWWACLSARDLLPDGSDKLTPSIKAAEDWVLQPSEETRALARAALDSAPNDDDTVFCAMAATFADGTLGPGEYEDYDAPPGAVGSAAFSIALIAMFDREDETETRATLLLERALDISRGGSGQVNPLTFSEH